MPSFSSAWSFLRGINVISNNLSKSGSIHSHVYCVSLIKRDGHTGWMFWSCRTAARHIAANLDGEISC